MSHQIPSDAARLIERARVLADEMASAARYGVPIPATVCIDHYAHGDVTFSCGDDRWMFDSWVDYAEAQVEEYDYDGHHWHRAAANVNGLSLTFSMTSPATLEVVAS